jgi:hypothetical protein
VEPVDSAVEPQAPDLQGHLRYAVWSGPKRSATAARVVTNPAGHPQTPHHLLGDVLGDLVWRQLAVDRHGPELAN